MEELSTFSLSEVYKQEVRVIKAFLSCGDGDRAIVLTQRVPNAQGPDLRVLRPSVEDDELTFAGEYSLDMYQAKNLKGFCQLMA